MGPNKCVAFYYRILCELSVARMKKKNGAKRLTFRRCVNDRFFFIGSICQAEPVRFGNGRHGSLLICGAVEPVLVVSNQFRFGTIGFAWIFLQINIQAFFI